MLAAFASLLAAMDGGVRSASHTGGCHDRVDVRCGVHAASDKHTADGDGALGARTAAGAVRHDRSGLHGSSFVRFFGPDVTSVIVDFTCGPALPFWYWRMGAVTQAINARARCDDGVKESYSEHQIRTGTSDHALLVGLTAEQVTEQVRLQSGLEPDRETWETWERSRRFQSRTHIIYDELEPYFGEGAFIDAAGTLVPRLVADYVGWCHGFHAAPEPTEDNASLLSALDIIMRSKAAAPLLSYL